MWSGALHAHWSDACFQPIPFFFLSFSFQEKEKPFPLLSLITKSKENEIRSELGLASLKKKKEGRTR